LSGLIGSNLQIGIFVLLPEHLSTAHPSPTK